MWKLQLPPTEKKSPSLFEQPPSKSWGPVKPPLFENLIGGSTLPAERKGCTLCHLCLILEAVTQWFWTKRSLKCRCNPWKIHAEKFVFNSSFRLEVKGKECNYCMYIKSRICHAFIFIVDCLSSFYSALYFQGQLWQKWYLKFRFWEKLDIFWLGEAI